MYPGNTASVLASPPNIRNSSSCAFHHCRGQLLRSRPGTWYRYHATFVSSCCIIVAVDGCSSMIYTPPNICLRADLSLSAALTELNELVPLSVSVSESLLSSVILGSPGRSGGRLNIKMSFQYRDPHVKDKTVSWPSYLIFNMGITIPGKDGLYIETGSWILRAQSGLPLVLFWQSPGPGLQQLTANWLM